VPRAPANGIELEYETFGDSSKPAMLLVMGLGVQLLGWDEEFCRMLAGRGFFVIRYDNRDVGLSSKIEDAPPPDLMALMAGDTSVAAYRVEDMADDAVGLLDHLGIDAAHVAGISMGGMIAQALAIHHPERVLSLCSIMSTTGDPVVGQAKETAMAALISPAPEGRDAYIDFGVRMFGLVGSPGYPADEQRLRGIIAASYDRSYYPIGFLRQLAGVMASPDRTPALAGVTAPTLVIHGEEDPLITPSGGEATARAIPGARLVLIPGMGHDFPPALWPRLVDEIVANADRAPAQAGAAQA
jgi:pimeloyl-ACP methyl ester carboxylesterase